MHDNMDINHQWAHIVKKVMKVFKLYNLPFSFFNVVIVLHKFCAHVFTNFVFVHHRVVEIVTVFVVVQNVKEIIFQMFHFYISLHEYTSQRHLYEQRNELVKQIHLFHNFFKMANQVIRVNLLFVNYVTIFEMHDYNLIRFLNI